LENVNKIPWRAKEIVYYGQKYAKRDQSDEIYDFNSYKKALQNGDLQPLLIGHWAMDAEGKQFIRLIDEEEKQDTTTSNSNSNGSSRSTTDKDNKEPNKQDTK
jgi:hypothetical protein